MSDNTTLGHAIFTDLEKNEYLNEIYNSILYNYAIKLLGLADNQAEAINLDDALRFADILSKSYGVPNSEMHHLWAQEIVALLNELYQTTRPSDIMSARCFQLLAISEA